jgi:very-short-patch-repair endonuclease
VLATGQHAVVALWQLTPLGIGASTLRKRAAAGRLHRIHHGVYSLVPRELLTPAGHWMAAVLACGPDAVLSHRTAAALHGLRPSYRTKIDVMVPGRVRRNRADFDVHRSTTLRPGDVTMVNGIPCTTVARTLLDLAEVVDRRALERAFDQSEVRQVFDLYAIEDQVARNSTRPGAGRVRAILSEHYIGSTLTESELEELVLAICRRSGAREPKVNRWVDLGDGEPPIRADFVWYEQRVIVETDGPRFHDTHQRRERDPRRDQRALLAGWRLLRVTWRQAVRRPDELGQTIVRLVGRRPGPQPQQRSRRPTPSAPG